MADIRKIGTSLFFIFIMGSFVAMAGDYEKGKKMAMSKGNGNCLACHKMQGAEQPGNMGPELIDLKSKYPTDELLRAQVWDATRINAISAMPPFGRNRILTEEEIDDIVAYLKTL